MGSFQGVPTDMLLQEHSRQECIVICWLLNPNINILSPSARLFLVNTWQHLTLRVPRTCEPARSWCVETMQYKLKHELNHELFPVWLSVSSWVCLSVHVSICLLLCLSTCTFLSFFLSLFLLFCLPVCLGPWSQQALRQRNSLAPTTKAVTHPRS